MRARNIKPGFFVNELLGQADPFLSLLFAGLWCLSDKAGRLEDRPLRIKAEIFPYRESLDINRYLTELSRLGFIIRYQVASRSLIQVVNFSKHQSPHHTEKGSILPGVSVGNTDGCLLTVDSPLENGGNPPDSLIPDSLIPDSLIPDSLIPDSITPNHNPKKPTRQKQPSWNQKFPSDVVEATNEILEFWPDGKKDIQPKKCAADPTQYVPETHSRFLAARLADIQQEGGDLKICVEIAKQYVDSYKRGRNWVKAAEYFFGKTEDAKWKAYYQSEITNREIEAHEPDPA